MCQFAKKRMLQYDNKLLISTRWILHIEYGLRVQKRCQLFTFLSVR